MLQRDTYVDRSIALGNRSRLRGKQRLSRRVGTFPNSTFPNSKLTGSIDTVSVDSKVGPQQNSRNSECLRDESFRDLARLWGLPLEVVKEYSHILKIPGHEARARDPTLEEIFERGESHRYLFMDPGSFISGVMNSVGNSGVGAQIRTQIRRIVARVFGQRAPGDFSKVYMREAGGSWNGPDITGHIMYNIFRGHLEKHEDEYRKNPISLEGAVMDRIIAQYLILHVHAPRSSWKYANLLGSRVQGDLSGADFSYATLSHMPESNLRSANLEGAVVKVDRRSETAEFHGTDLSYAKMRNMQIDSGTSFYGAIMEATDLRGSVHQLAKTKDIDSIITMNNVKILPREEKIMLELISGRPWTYQVVVDPNNSDPGERMWGVDAKPLEAVAMDYVA